MIERIFAKTGRIMAKACAIAAALVGFGNAIRCAFVIDYPTIMDRIVYTAVMICVGIVGIWLAADRGE